MNDTIKKGFAMFSGSEISFSDDVFEGANLTAIFGGITCDLRGAKITDGVVINALAMFGGIDLLFDDNVNVKVNSTSIFGGVEDKRRKSRDENAVTVHINATCIFGGVDLK